MATSGQKITENRESRLDVDDVTAPACPAESQITKNTKTRPDQGENPAAVGAVQLQKLLRSQYGEARDEKSSLELGGKGATIGDVETKNSEANELEKANLCKLEKQETSRSIFSFTNAKRTRQIIKSIVGILLIIAAGWAPSMRLFQVSSVEAIVNARVVTLRTPISGVVEFEPGKNRFDVVEQAGALIASVENPRVDRVKFIELTKQLDLAKVDLQHLIAQQKVLQDREGKLAGQAASYNETRIKAVQSRLEEIKAAEQEFKAKLQHAIQKHARNSELHFKKIVSTERFDETAAQVAIFSAGLDRVRARRQLIELELTTLANGEHFGDHFNDRTRQAVEIEATHNRLSELDVRIDAQKARITSLKNSLNMERDSLERLEKADIVLPVSGQVWETLVATGEQVSQGQPLIRVLDCARALVTTAVSEEVYNSLVVGSSATFILRESGHEFAAKVAQLSGVSSSAANLAILPSALLKEPYRATVEVPGLGANGTCLLGKTGRVVFSDKT